MENFKVVAGKTGSGKSRTLLSKIKKLGEQGETIFAVNLEYNQGDLIHVEGIDLKLFESVESMLNYISVEKVDTKQIVLVVDNGYININSSNIESLNELKFNQTIVSLQLSRAAEINEKSEEEISKTIFSRWGIKEFEIDVDFITSPPQLT